MSRAPVLESLPDFTPADAAPEDRVHWLKVDYEVVEGLFHAHVVKVQRNHMRRLLHADHLTKVDSPLHRNFIAARLPDGSVQLIDGYTRIAAVEAGQKPRPAKVWLGVVDADSTRAVETLYLAVDSRRAVKTGRDAFEEGLRKAGLLGKLKSPLFVRGNGVSALQAASGDDDVLAAVVKFKKAIERLDALALPGGRYALPAGALGACLLLAQHEDDSMAVQQFAAAVARPELVPKDQAAKVPGGLKLAEWLAERREQGALSGKNVGVILQHALGFFRWQQEGAKGRAVPITRSDYLASA